MAAPVVRTRATTQSSRLSATQRRRSLVAARPRPLLSPALAPRPSFCGRCRRRSHRTAAGATAEQQQQHPPGATADSGEPDALELQYGWRGADAFSPLGDRADAPPLPLPPVRGRVRVVLVRHGQSTWNAEGRVQGSSDGSELTAKGKAQARAAGEMVRLGFLA